MNKENKRMYWVGGSKGGVGKSMMAMALLDYLLETQRRVMLIECDTDNPDVYKAHQNLVPAKLISLDEREGWMGLVEACESDEESVVVVNTAARSNTSVRRYGELLVSGLELLEMTLETLWVINRQRDSLELLANYMDAMPHGRVHVVRNAYFGEEGKFDLYNTSKVRERVETRGGKSITFPDVADRVADDMYTKRWAVRVAAKEMPIGNRIELVRWRNEVRKTLGPVMAS